MCVKRFRIAAFGSFEPFCLFRAKLNGRVGSIPTYKVYDTYTVYVTGDLTKLLDQSVVATYVATVAPLCAAYIRMARSTPRGAIF